MLMKTYLYKLKFLSPLHISSDPLSLGKAEVVIHSDTLFSAIANSFAMLFDLGDEFFSSPPFLISSAFPYYKETLFFPKPFGLRIDPSLFEKFRKKVKKAKFVSSGIFEKYLKGEGISPSEESFSGDGFMSEEPIKEPVYVYYERPRSTVPRVSGYTEIFYSTSVEFGENAGLYFFAEFRAEQMKRQFDSALYLLGDTGIGGERSTGYGRFLFQSEEIEKPGKESGEYFITLSLYYPSKEEINNGILNSARYSLLTRQNWIFSGRARPVRSKSVRMFAEGSLFRNSTDVKGRMADITPEIALENPEYKLEHRIMRYGKLFKAIIPEKAIQGRKK